MSPKPRLVSSSPRPPLFLRFDPFELDVRAGELRKHGTKLRLRTQTLQILLILLEHPGEVVLREEIRQQLWPGDTTVEFDHGINAAVQKLRDALGESADAPRYIETLPRRGYRFLGEVERVGEEPVSESTETGPALVAPIPLAAEEPAEKPKPRPWFSKVKLAATIALTVLVGLGIWLRPFLWRPSTVAHNRNFTYSLGPISASTVVSPDGSSIAYTTPAGLFVRRLDSLTENQLDGPVPFLGGPMWSPDSSELAYERSEGLIRRQVSKGTWTRVCPPVVGLRRGMTWGSKGTILFALIVGDQGHLYAVPTSGETPSQIDVPSLQHGLFFSPEFLPNREDFLFAFAGEADEQAGLYLATLQNLKVTRAPTLLRKNITAGHYSPYGGGRLLYVQDDNLFSQELDAASAMLKGEPQQILQGVYSVEHTRAANFSVSSSGVLVWRAGKASQSHLTWFDRKGNVLGTAGQPGPISSISLSPDERHVLVTLAERRSGIVESNSSGFLPLPGVIRRPVWMPDSEHILYCKWEPNRCRLMERAAAGGLEAEVAQLPEMASPRDVSPDGNFVLYTWKRIVHVARIGRKADQPVPEIALGSFSTRFSPNGHWIVYDGYDRDQAARQILIQPFPALGLPTQISTKAGGYPEWRGDGKEIIYSSGNPRNLIREATLYSVRLEIKNNEIQAAPPEELFRARFPDTLFADAKPMAVTRDGSRILIARSIDDAEPHINVMTAWSELLKH